MRICLLIAVLALCVASTPAKGIKLKPAADSHADGAATQLMECTGDTIASLIEISGYDKPLTSRKESLFLRNGLGRDIAAVTLNIIYMQPDGTELHRREITLTHHIESGARRMIVFPSWDRQCSFRYAGSRPSKREHAVYTVSIKPVSVTVYR